MKARLLGNQKHAVFHERRELGRRFTSQLRRRRWSSKIDDVWSGSFPYQRKLHPRLAAEGVAIKDIVMSDYDKLQRLLQARCTTAAVVLV